MLPSAHCKNYGGWRTEPQRYPGQTRERWAAATLGATGVGEDSGPLQWNDALPVLLISDNDADAGLIQQALAQGRAGEWRL